MIATKHKNNNKKTIKTYINHKPTTHTDRKKRKWVRFPLAALRLLRLYFVGREKDDEMVREV